MSGMGKEAGNTPSKREMLDVESPAERQERLGRLLTSQTPSAPSSPFSLPRLRPNIGPLPQSDLLARVRDFLPLLASSNENLLARAQANPGEVDIENTQGDERVIEMDLGLGVFDVQGKAKGDMGPEHDIPQVKHRQHESGDKESGDQKENQEEATDKENTDDASDTSSDTSSGESDETSD